MSQLISIIITTKNEAEVIGKLLLSINNQTYKNHEIILVDNNSSDNTTKIAEKLGVKSLNFGPERSAQRNFGAKKAKGSYLLFLDADMRLSENVVKECVEIINKNKNVGAINIPEVSQAANFWEKVKAFERSFYNDLGDPYTDAARFFSKNAFLKSGGYDEAITGPEDWDLPDTVRELGFKIFRIRAKIYHQERISSPFVLAKKKFYYGLKAYRYLSKHRIPILGPKTIYFLRPVFYKNFKKIIAHPILSLGMIFMLSVELFGGGLGYIIGRLRKF